MSYRHLLEKHYGLSIDEQVTFNGRKGFLANGVFYFTTNVVNIETIHLEQTVIAYYLAENGYNQVALPIKNINDQWFSDAEVGRYLVYRVQAIESSQESLGTTLAKFHQVGSAYPYEPNAISSYGDWKQLWIQKLTTIEENIQSFIKNAGSPAHEALFQALPYLIGMSENAIQYLRETEEGETRFLEADQGAVTCLRFHAESLQEIIWPDQFVYDHPIRDIAEYIRSLYLNDSSDQQVQTFLADYQIIRPLSIFSIRLLYARLLFPIHLFDAIERCLHDPKNLQHFKDLSFLLKQQQSYESRLKRFFVGFGIDKDAFHLSELDWL